METLIKISQLDPVELYILIQYLLVNLAFLYVIIKWGFNSKVPFLKRIGVILLFFVLKVVLITGLWLYLWFKSVI